MYVFGLWEEDQIPGENPQTQPASGFKPRTFSLTDCVNLLSLNWAYLSPVNIN